ncbi:protein phosphatase 2C domain-containing protein [Streptomyces sp. NPDC020681]|uniref:protein phosphatase 2C domain-containing protein n=1 Tax=Streptomyces sp. NPDC020681 TaxID=3365083 RepID=UPI0037A0852D
MVFGRKKERAEDQKESAPSESSAPPASVPPPGPTPPAPPPPPPPRPRQAGGGYVQPQYLEPGYAQPQYGEAGQGYAQPPQQRRQEAPPQQPPATRPRTPEPHHGPRHAPVPQHALVPQHAPVPQRAPGPRRPGPDRWDRIVLGRAAAVPEPKPPPTDPYRPDTVFDGWSTPSLTVRLASVRGDEHRCSGRPRQDDIAVAWHERTDTVVFAVADGVSAAPLSHIGAALACRTAVSDVLGQLDEDRAKPDWTRVVQAAAYQLLMRIARSGEPTDEHRKEALAQLATTLVAGRVFALSDGGLQADLVHVGDTAAWHLADGRYYPLLDVEGDDDISTSAVLALPRLPPTLRPRSYRLSSQGALLVGTDGFGVPLGDGTGLVGDLMNQELARPPREPRTLAHLLDFSRETFDDDRTLLAVWPRQLLAEGTP